MSTLIFFFMTSSAIITGGLTGLSSILRRKAKGKLFIVPLTNGLLMAGLAIANMMYLRSYSSSNLYRMELQEFGMFFLLSGLPAIPFAILAGSLINRVTEEWFGPHVKSATADHIVGTIYFVISLIINAIALVAAFFAPTMFAIG